MLAVFQDLAWNNNKMNLMQKIMIFYFLGGLEMNSIRRLGRLARGEDSLSPYYSMVADAIIGLGSILYETIFS